jgi:peptidyl-prolyl cis-trans isomerase D
MLDAIRKRTGSIVVKLLLGLLVLSFGAWGIGDYINGNASGVAAATVGDREVSAETASRELQREVNRLRQYLGDQATLETARAFGLDQEVIRRLVRAQLYSLAAQSHGIVVSNDDVRAQIQSMPAFRGLTGNFDRNTFRQAISNAGYSENGFVELIRDEIKQSMVVGSLDAGASAPAAMVDQIYAYRNETRSAQFTTILDADFDNVPVPGEATVSAYHQDNADKFMAPEYRDVTYVHLRAQDLAAGIEVSEEQLEEAFESREAEFVTRATRNVDQAIFTSEEQANEALGMISDGQVFADVASTLTGAAADTLALGWITPDQLMGDDAAAAVFGTAPGNLAGPVKSMLGWHLFHVVDGTEESRQTLADVRDTLRLDVAMDRALNDLFELANQLEDELASGATLEEASAQLNVGHTTVPAMDQTGSDVTGTMVSDLPAQSFLGTAFATEEGSESPLVESGSDAYFIVRVNGVTSPALRPLDTIRDDVIAAIMADERAKLGKATADAIAAKLNANADLVALAVGYGSELVHGEGFKRDGTGLPDGIPPQMAVELFDTTLGAGAVIRRTDGYIVGHLNGISMAPLDRSNDAFTALKTELNQGLRGDIVDQLSAALEIRYPVSINRAALDQAIGAY